MATHSSTLAWQILWVEEPGRLQSMGSQRVGHDWATSLPFTSHARKVMLKILQARLQQYVNHELPDVQAGFRKGRGTNDQGKNTWVGCHFLLQCMKMKVKSLSCVWLFETPWTAAYQAPPSMGFSRQEFWSGVPSPSLNLIFKSTLKIRFKTWN